jgi:hypothetical protein
VADLQEQLAAIEQQHQLDQERIKKLQKELQRQRQLNSRIQSDHESDHENDHESYHESDHASVLYNKHYENGRLLEAEQQKVEDLEIEIYRLNQKLEDQREQQVTQLKLEREYRNDVNGVIDQFQELLELEQTRVRDLIVENDRLTQNLQEQQQQQEIQLGQRHELQEQLTQQSLKIFPIDDWKFVRLCHLRKYQRHFETIWTIEECRVGL